MTNPPVLDLLAKYDPLIAEHAGLLSTGIRDPFGIVMEKVLSPTEAIIKGRHTILLGHQQATAPSLTVRRQHLELHGRPAAAVQ
jgi:hypothetical protein